MIDGERIAEERIEEAARTGQDWLDLGDLGLERLPENLSKLTSLRRLSLGRYFVVTSDGVKDRKVTTRGSFASLRHLTQLTNLTQLYLDGTGCFDLSPISALHQLQRLDCRGSQVSDLSPLLGLQGLQELNFMGTKVTDLAPLMDVHSLISLDFVETRVSDLEPIRGMQYLQFLRCSSTKITDLSPLAGLPELKYLHCWDTEISDLDPIEYIPNIEQLDCWGTQITDLGPLNNAMKLKYLNCSVTIVDDLSPLLNLTNLHHLDCRNTFVTDLSPLSRLLNLKIIDCSNTKIVDLHALAQLEGLEQLDFSSTRVSDIAPLSSLRKLQKLNFNNTKVQSLKPLLQIQMLEYLACSYSKVSDLSPIISSKGLKHLDCESTNLHDLGPIERLPGLEYFDCDHTQVTDVSPLAKLENLTLLSCENCNISFLPASFGKLSRLRKLNLRKNKLNFLPHELGNVWELEQAARTGAKYDGDLGLLLEGNPLEDSLQALIAPGQPQATVNVLRWLRGEAIAPEAKEPDPPIPLEDADEPPAIPEQGAGPRVILDQTGRLVFARPSDLDAKGNDRNRLEALHPALREAAAELTNALQNHTSNLRNERLLQKAEAYRALVDLPLDEVNFARLYGAGMQLLNAAGATRRALEAGRADVPDLTPIQDECLENIENLHPPFVLASRDGAEMLADQTTIKLTADHVEVIKEAGEALGKALLQRPDLAAPEIGKTMRDAAAEIGQGENAARDAVNAVSATRNTVIVAVWVATAVSLPTIGSGFAGVPGAVSGGLLGYFLGESVKASGHFKNMAKRGGKLIDASAEIDLRTRVEEWRTLLIQNSRYLRNMMHVPKFEWLKPVIDRLKRNSPPDKKE
jgi:Leucine-rich repeat (LRR) protein